jgi:stringent starvation protein B
VHFSFSAAVESTRVQQEARGLSKAPHVWDGRAAGKSTSVTEPVEDTVALSADEVAEITGEAEEQDETGAPEKVAETEETHPLESPEALREPRDDEEQDRAPQPGATPDLDGH